MHLNVSLEGWCNLYCPKRDQALFFVYDNSSIGEQYKLVYLIVCICLHSQAFKSCLACNYNREIYREMNQQLVYQALMTLPELTLLSLTLEVFILSERNVVKMSLLSPKRAIPKFLVLRKSTQKILNI